MTCLANLEKTPNDHLDYDIDFSRWLPQNDIIVDANAFIADSDVTFIVTSVETAEQVVRVWVDNGIDGEESEIAVYVTTLGGREKEACFKLRIREC
jgi:hypothetical protein